MMKGMIIKNMSFKVGQTLTIVGVATPEATNFALNIGPDDQEITMHMNPRFNAHGDENVVVCNSYQQGQWCEEHREGGFPFHQGEEFKIVIEFTPTEFQVTLSDGSAIHFPNRIGAEKYSVFSFDGDVRVRSFEINFEINIGPDDKKIAMQMSVHFDACGDKGIVFSKSVRQGSFPFKKGHPFKIVIKFTATEFHVTLSDGSTIHLPNRIGAKECSFFSFDGDVRIKSIEVK